MKVLFIAPHLSTGGMPAFLLKRVEALQKYTDWEIHVIEWKNLSPDYIVQKPLKTSQDIAIYKI